MSTVSQKLTKLAEKRKLDEILIYFTGDRQPENLFSTQIATDVIPIFAEHLRQIGKKKRLGLFLYSNGGQLQAPWPLVSLLREYCDYLEVIVPYKAFSAATLICLGADKISMTPMSYLSPIDPQGTFVVKDGNRIQVGIEDISGFIDFAKNKVGIVEQSGLTEVLKALSQEVTPPVLGSINRTYSLIRSLATNMIALHRNKMEENQCSLLVENLTEKLFSHNHMISRKEAKDRIGFKNLIHQTNSEEDKLIRDLFDTISNQMGLSEPFAPETVLGTENNKVISVERGIIQSKSIKHAYLSDFTYQRNNQPAPKPFNVSVADKGWKKV